MCGSMALGNVKHLLHSIFGSGTVFYSSCSPSNDVLENMYCTSKAKQKIESIVCFNLTFTTGKRVTLSKITTTQKRAHIFNQFYCRCLFCSV